MCIRDSLKDIQKEYVDGTADLKDALNSYIDLYTDCLLYTSLRGALGTVAGDNTIMIAAESPEAAVEVERAIDRLRRR